MGPNGSSIDAVQLDDLHGIELSSGITVDELLGAEVTASTTDGTETGLRISGIASGTGSNADLLYYVVHAKQGGAWQPICGTAGNGQPIPALAVPGYWNLDIGTSNGGEWKPDGDRFSFACRGSSIAKCMEAGYKPWVDPFSKDGRISERERSDRDKPSHLQACVRMLRADYCGDGVSHTVDGRTVEFWDTMGMHKRKKDNWTFEAAWTPYGAMLMNHPRVEIGGRMPWCFNDRRDQYLGDATSHGAAVDDAKKRDLGRLHDDRGLYILSSYERFKKVR